MALDITLFALYILFTQISQYLRGICVIDEVEIIITRRGILSPQQPWRYSPHILTSTPPYANPPHTIFGHYIRSFVRFLCVFSVNLGSCRWGIMTQKKQKYRWSW